MIRALKAHSRNYENVNDGRVDWLVRDKKPRPLDKIGQVKKSLSHQLVLRDRRHNDCVLSRTRVNSWLSKVFNRSSFLH